ncbi:hypothetical protein DVH24_020771 [Malus domestica]|uniref:DUF676 domain-containing protein n=1 Tax=Malus domestica TaxID=3750 RepID=A0A498J7V1_MALDO|nr:hypothetical protein DVH24_020771 [Malus domestica]
MGGLVVKQTLHKARADNIDNLVKNTIGVVFYSCPHFGSKLADMPWRIGFVFRPAPTIGELRSGSPRLVLDSTDHINLCKPLSRSDPSYTEILPFLRKLKASQK